MRRRLPKAYEDAISMDRDLPEMREDSIAIERLVPNTFGHQSKPLSNNTSTAATHCVCRALQHASASPQREPSR